MKLKSRSSVSPLRKKAKRGFRGYPVASVALYGPTDQLATKIVVGVCVSEDAEPTLKKWFTQDKDIRLDYEIGAQVSAFLLEHGVQSVIMTDGVFGCPHEEGIDYPDGQSCPQCPYWAGRDRITHELIH
jgi:hypothetical protein